jgi:F-type H+-transporting ATPase subunit delta
MSDFKLSYRYSKSLIELAESQKSLDTVANDLEFFLQVCETSREFSTLLKKPIVKSSQKRQILENIFKEKISQLTLSFFSLIAKKGREYFLRGIAREYLRQWKIKKGIVDAYITSAIPLTQELNLKIVALIEDSIKGRIELHSHDDKEVLGGFLLKIGDKQIDETLRSKLNRVRMDLV